jgi:hypothetical protein
VKRKRRRRRNKKSKNKNIKTIIMSADETKVSWSGTLTLILLWGIGPLIYLGIYIVNLLKRKYYGGGGGGIENLEAVVEEEAAVAVAVAVAAAADPAKTDDGDDKNEKKEVDDDGEVTTFADSDHEGSVQNWTSTQYLFSLIGYAIGIGNVWRFCYIIAQDGGSASLFGT